MLPIAIDKEIGCFGAFVSQTPISCVQTLPSGCNVNLVSAVDTQLLHGLNVVTSSRKHLWGQGQWSITSTEYNKKYYSSMLYPNRQVLIRLSQIDITHF